MVLLALLFSGPGCQTLDPNGIYNSDKVLYTEDISLITAYDFLHTFVKWEYDNRVLLESVPGVKKHADYIRLNAKQWFSTAIAYRDFYAQQPTDSNKTAMLKAYAILHQVVAQATLLMIQASKGT